MPDDAFIIPPDVPACLVYYFTAVVYKLVTFRHVQTGHVIGPLIIFPDHLCNRPVPSMELPKWQSTMTPLARSRPEPRVP